LGSVLTVLPFHNRLGQARIFEEVIANKIDDPELIIWLAKNGGTL